LQYCQVQAKAECSSILRLNGIMLLAAAAPQPAAAAAAAADAERGSKREGSVESVLILLKNKLESGSKIQIGPKSLQRVATA
jgi:hypothetical protein